MSPAALSDEITAFQEKFIPTIPEQTLKLLMDELQGLIEKGMAEQAINVGDSFPDFDLPNADNQASPLSAFLDDGPLVISFYRGAWCPYCNLEINALQQRLDDIRAAGAQLIAISPQTPDKSTDQISASKLTFDVLSDVGNKLARQCGLVFTLPESLRPIYAAWELDIPGHNGDDSFELPMPATFIVGTDGKINYAFIDMDYTKRLEPAVIIEQLKQL
ncbi:MAG TPA: AhpC/TSA family protein [Gammaproteobacteria bacterium]|nr:AhpC/TSA family protein [Gammaproteobacteria bacterium]